MAHIRSSVDLGKAFDYFKEQSEDIEAQLRRQPNQNGYAFAYGRLKGLALFHLQTCTDSTPQPDDIPQNLFTQPGITESEITGELEVNKTENNMHSGFSTVFGQLGEMLRPEPNEWGEYVKDVNPIDFDRDVPTDDAGNGNYPY